MNSLRSSDTRPWKWLMILFLLCLSLSPAQEAGVPAAEPPAPPPQDETIVPTEQNTVPLINETLKSLAESMEKTSAALKETESRTSHLSPGEKAEAEAQAAELRQKLKDLTSRFEITARGSGTGDSQESQTTGDVSLMDDLGGLLKPYLRELREATRQPREIDSLSREVLREKSRLQTESAVSLRIESLLDADPAPEKEVKERLTRMAADSKSAQEEIKGRIASLELQITDLRRNAPSLFTLISSNLVDFWKSRGISIILAIVVAGATLYLGMLLLRMMKRYSPLHRRYGNEVGVRLLNFAVFLAIGIAAAIAPLTVLYIRNDWLLLTLAMLMLIGLIMASRSYIIPGLEQLRLYLNMGNVRVGERVMLQGLPWRIDTLRFYCRLVNPDLTGARMRLPSSQLRGLVSRPSLPDEPWFPTRVGDWTLLDDGTMGKVMIQTPEQIVLLKLGGTRKTFITTDFLANNPENLSLKDLGVSTVFGLDYRHQDIALTTIPAELEREATQAVFEKFGKEEIISVSVDFDEAAASSLNFALMVSAKGSLAPRAKAIQRTLQRAALTCATKHGWTVPFPQITVNQPAPPSPAPALPAPAPAIAPKLP